MTPERAEEVWSKVAPVAAALGQVMTGETWGVIKDSDLGEQVTAAYARAVADLGALSLATTEDPDLTEKGHQALVEQFGDGEC